MTSALIAAAILLQGDDATEAFGRVLRSTKEKVQRSVVSILVTRSGKREDDPDGFGPTGGAGTGKDYYNRPAGPCTGTIWTDDGYIITSWFNVSGNPKSITVTTPDGKEYPAIRLGHDEARDVALLKIEVKNLPLLTKAKFDDLKQGDFVAIVGRAPDKDAPTLNQGILSALGRQKNTAVQTDAELNYGNVGGPLVTLTGELIGITSHIKPQQPWGQSGGVGFATKVSEIEKIFEDLKKSKVVGGPKAKALWVGALFADGGEGVMVQQVVANSPAEDAGFEEGDVVLEFDGKAVKTIEELQKAMAEKKAGDTVPFKVKRKTKDGKETTKVLKAKLEVNPN